MSGLTTSSTSRVRRLFVALAMLVSLSAPGVLPQAALAYGVCDAPVFKDGKQWMVPLFDGDCARYSGS